MTRLTWVTRDGRDREPVGLYMGVCDLELQFDNSESLVTVSVPHEQCNKLACAFREPVSAVLLMPVEVATACSFSESAVAFMSSRVP